MFSYLDRDDSEKFKLYLGTELEDMLVAGSSTNCRLERYLGDSDFYQFRIILTALVKDFEFPCVRFTSVLALTIYSMTMESSGLQQEKQDIVLQELNLIKKHLMEDELIRYMGGLSIIIDRWGE